jgi:integrin alpha FG-GAP repeat containing protein 1
VIGVAKLQRTPLTFLRRLRMTPRLQRLSVLACVILLAFYCVECNIVDSVTGSIGNYVESRIERQLQVFDLDAWGYSPSPWYFQSKLYDQNTHLGGVNGWFAAFGDFNSDKLTDAFVVSADRLSVTVYRWKNTIYGYEKTSARIEENDPIYAVYATDFNHDGKLDILVMGSPQLQPFVENPYPYSPSSVDHLYLHIYYGDKSNMWSFSNVDSPKILPNTTSTVLLADLNGDNYPDLVGTLASNGKISIFWSREESSEWQVETLEDGGQGSRAMLTPNPAVFVDLTGDCAAELVLFTLEDALISGDETSYAVNMEVWVREDEESYRLRESKTLSGSHIISVVVYDVNADGILDIAASRCYPLGNCSEISEIVVTFGEALPICQELFPLIPEEIDFRPVTCRKKSQLCGAPSSSVQSFASDNLLTISLDMLAPPSQWWTSFPSFGDINLDGIPDMLVPLYSVEKSDGSIVEEPPLSPEILADASQSQSTVRHHAIHLYFGEYCAGESTVPCVTFRDRVESDTSALTSVPDAWGAGFLQMGQSGRLDIVVNTWNKLGIDPSAPPSTIQSNIYSTKTIYNNFESDGFWLRTTALNGICTAFCSGGGEEEFPWPEPTGVNTPAPIWRIGFADVDGLNHIHVQVPLSSALPTALSQPFAFFGLGRVGNYIENAVLGMSATKEQFKKRDNSDVPSEAAWQAWTGIIPNAQVTAQTFPYSDPASWSLALTISPGWTLPFVTLAYLLALIIIAAIIGGLHYREVYLDQQEKKKHDEKTGNIFGTM